MADSHTTSVTTAGPALFTHDGYELYVFDGVPCMLDTDIGNRLGMAEDKAIRKLIERQKDNLLLLDDSRHPVAKPGHGVPVSSATLRRGPAPRKKGSRGPSGHAYYLDQKQVRWIVIKSGMPEADVLLRQLLSVFDAWERGELVTRAEAADAALARQSVTTPASVAGHHHYALEQSRFLIEGPPAMVPSDFLASIKADNRFTRIGTRLPLTITIVEDQVRIFDVDLGHAIGGQATHKARPRAREILSSLRRMGTDPWHQIRYYDKLSPTDRMTSVFLLNHEQALAVSTMIDPGNLSGVHDRINMLFYHVATGTLSEIVYGRDAAMIARAIDCAAVSQSKGIPIPKPPAVQRLLPLSHPDPFPIVAIERATARAVQPLLEDVSRLAELLHKLPKAEAIATLRSEVAELRDLVNHQIAAGREPETGKILSRLSGLLGRLKGTAG